MPSLKRMVMTGVRRLGVPTLLRRATRRRSSMLTYHGFSDWPVSGVGSHLHMDAKRFDSQLGFVAKRHAVVSAGDLVDSFEESTDLPGNAVVLTVDDGYRGIYDVAFPLLKKHSLRVAVFLATDFVDGRDFLWHDRVSYCLEHAASPSVELEVGGRSLVLDLSSPDMRIHSSAALGRSVKDLGPDPGEAVLQDLEASTGCRLGQTGDVPPHCQPLSWSQVNEMADSGLVEFGSHTKSHTILSRCSDAEMRTELETSKARIEAETGRECDIFAYPNGTREDFSAATRERVREAGFRAGLTTVPALVSASSDVFELPRFSSNATLETLELKLAGFADLRRAIV